MGRKRKKDRITLKNIWHSYPYRYDQTHPYYCKRKLFCDINRDFNTLLAEMITDGHTFKVPGRGGNIRMKKFKSNGKKIDYRRTEEVYGEDVWEKNRQLPPEEKMIIHHTNKHSDGWAARWWWRASKWWKFTGLYRFTATRTNQRMINKKISSDNIITEYLQ